MTMAAPDALLATLDRDQRAAATHPDGPLRVIAGAGTGKTHQPGDPRDEDAPPGAPGPSRSAPWRS
jgi:DNA helicase-2/ATP-dependent DNA helicase PcrA